MHFPRSDCGADTYREFYLLKSWIWKRAAGHIPEVYDDELCIGCLEARLGRELTSADFIDCPLNNLDWRQLGWPMSDRLRDRLTRIKHKDSA